MKKLAKGNLKEQMNSVEFQRAISCNFGSEQLVLGVLTIRIIDIVSYSNNFSGARSIRFILPMLGKETGVQFSTIKRTKLELILYNGEDRVLIIDIKDAIRTGDLDIVLRELNVTPLSRDLKVTRMALQGSTVSEISTALKITETGVRCILTRILGEKKCT